MLYEIFKNSKKKCNLPKLTKRVPSYRSVVYGKDNGVSTVLRELDGEGREQRRGGRGKKSRKGKP